MKVADFDFSLPEDLIAKNPAEKRDSARLLVLHRDGKIEHRIFSDLPEYLDEGDMLLLNDTRVFPARITGTKPTGGRMEILLIAKAGRDTWRVLSKKKYAGKISISEGFSAYIENGIARFTYSGDFMENLWRYGDMPLPPYIKRLPVPADKERYQTIYAENEGSIAAPTAGLHFTMELLDKLMAKGINVGHLTLHVGIGTFKPIKAENVEEHSMEREYFEIAPALVEDIKKVKASGKKIFSVGTTTTRAIEGYLSNQFSVASCQRNGTIRGHTDIFIYPGHEFKAVDALVTNFHLPRSTPLMLASALCGFKKLKKAYDDAIAGKYRFFSYGDAMLIL